MKIKDIAQCIEEFAPLCLQESYDNSGLSIGESGREVKKALICLDVTDAIIEEAIKESCDIIISHHPVIFGNGIKHIRDDNMTERIVKAAIKNDIAIYSAHTNLDNYYNGLNLMLCDKLGVRNTKIIAPKEDIKLLTIIFI